MTSKSFVSSLGLAVAGAFLATACGRAPSQDVATVAPQGASDAVKAAAEAAAAAVVAAAASAASDAPASSASSAAAADTEPKQALPAYTQAIESMDLANMGITAALADAADKDKANALVAQMQGLNNARFQLQFLTHPTMAAAIFASAKQNDADARREVHAAYERGFVGKPKWRALPGEWAYGDGLKLDILMDPAIWGSYKEDQLTGWNMQVKLVKYTKAKKVKEVTHYRYAGTCAPKKTIAPQYILTAKGADGSPVTEGMLFEGDPKPPANDIEKALLPAMCASIKTALPQLK